MKQRIGVVLSGVLLLLVIGSAPYAGADAQHANNNGQRQTKATKHIIAQFGPVKVQCDDQENCSCIEPKGRLFGFLPTRRDSEGFRCLTLAEIGVSRQVPTKRHQRRH